MFTYETLPAVNWSWLKHFAVSPKLARARLDTPIADTDSLRLGRELHACYLEPERWAATHVVCPDFGKMQSSINRAKRDAWIDEQRAAGITVVTHEHGEKVRRMVDALASHRVARDMLSVGRREECATWIDPTTGLPCKGRADFVGPAFVADLKTTSEETPDAFRKALYRFAYHGQLAWYHDGLMLSGALPRDAGNPAIVAVQSSEPWDVFAGVLSDDALEAGRRLRQHWILRLRDCLATDWWPGAAPDPITWELPRWAQHEET